MRFDKEMIAAANLKAATRPVVSDSGIATIRLALENADADFDSPEEID